MCHIADSWISPFGWDTQPNNEESFSANKIFSCVVEQETTKMPKIIVTVYIFLTK
jgi:hypothetical protein